MVRSRKLVMLALLGVVAANGCASMNHTERDALAGGGLGAVAGALIDRRHPGTGAAVGGIIGAGTGALVGHAADEDERRAKEAAAPVRGPLSMDEILTMTKAGTPDQLIINQIRASGTRYN